MRHLLQPQPAFFVGERIRVLVVDGGNESTERIVEALPRDSFDTVAVHDQDHVLYEFGLLQPHIVILDIPVSGADRWDTLRRLRDHSDVPIIALIPAGDEMGAVEGLKRGADHSLAKPISMKELEARVRALIRRTQFNRRSTPHCAYGRASYNAQSPPQLRLRP